MKTYNNLDELAPMFRLVITEWEGDNEYAEGGAPVTRDRYFGALEEVLYRLSFVGGLSHAIYERQSDRSWLLYYHSI